jgi:protein-disulfide isomerase
MKAPEILAHIEKTRALAQSIGVSGTPAMVVGDTLVPGAISYEQMVALVEAARAEDG